MRNSPHTKLLSEIFCDIHDDDPCDGQKRKIVFMYHTLSDRGHIWTFRYRGWNDGGDVAHIGARYINFECQEPIIDLCIENAVKAADTYAVDALQVMMTGGKDYPSEKPESF